MKKNEIRKEGWAKREPGPWSWMLVSVTGLVPQGKYGGGTDKAGEKWTNENFPSDKNSRGQ
jgi:hypothetical protein